ncbi:MAG: hypothetical protein SH847_27175, partial [Roseiflexaceae bacterium]|nr:hypothetical protein [Roseiflexaceae bacterium]
MQRNLRLNEPGHRRARSHMAAAAEGTHRQMHRRRARQAMGHNNPKSVVVVVVVRVVPVPRPAVFGATNR